MKNLIKQLSILLMLVTLSSLLIACGDSDEPDFPNNVSTEKKEVYIACFSSNYGELPSYSTAFYEDTEFRYLLAARNPKYELILLPYHKENGEWKPLYNYDKLKEVGKQLTPIKLNNEWVCSIRKYPTSLTEDPFEQMTSKLSFNSDSYLSVAPFNYRGCYYGYIMVEGGRKVNVKFYCSFLKMDHTQGSSTFGYITNAKLDYQLY